MSLSRDELRASDAERDAVVARLHEAFVEGRLTLAECDERTRGALAARTYGELQTLTRDLPAVGGAPPRFMPANASPSTPSSPAPEWTVAVMSEAKRNGRWRIDGPLNALALMSSVQLDLRQAEPTGSEIVVNVYCLMGSVRLIVPAGAQVEFHEISVMGSIKDARLATDPQPGTPTVRVRGFGLMGSLEVRTEEQTFLGKLSERVNRLLPPTPPGQLSPTGRRSRRAERKLERHADRLARRERREP